MAEVATLAFQDLQARLLAREEENQRLQVEIRDLRLELQEIKAMVGNTPDLAKLLSRTLTDVQSKLAPKVKGMLKVQN